MKHLGDNYVDKHRNRPEADVQQTKESPDLRGSLNHQYYLDQAFFRREKPMPASPKLSRARVVGSGTS